MNPSFLDFKVIPIIDADQILVQCSGNPESSIFICSNNLDQEAKFFLEKILTAVKLDLNQDVLLLEKTLGNDFSFSSLNNQHKIKRALFFAIAPADVGLQFNNQKYQPIEINNCLFLFADALSLIEQQQSLKKRLWTALKQIFT